ncbi:MAG: hypothetical protein ABIP06_02170 [Pyrinomonadaceae bacterium]
MKSFSVKLLLVILFLTSFLSSVQAQETCAWTKTSANIALNLRLGMTTAEVNAALGGKPKIKNKTRGEYRFFQNYIDDKPPAKLRNVRALYVRFFDGQLYQAEIFYDESFSPSLENFAALIAQQYSFSLTDFKAEKTKLIVRCGENTLAADDVLNPRIELTNEPILEKTNKLNEAKK